MVIQPRTGRSKRRRGGAGDEAFGLVPIVAGEGRAPLPAAKRDTGAAEARLPDLGAVDRHALLATATLDRLIRQDDSIIQILRYPIFGAYGADPNDPPWFSDRINARLAVCSALAPYAAARCFARRGRP
jgi:hypothetical protein